MPVNGPDILWSAGPGGYSLQTGGTGGQPGGGGPFGGGLDLNTILNFAMSRAARKDRREQDMLDDELRQRRIERERQKTADQNAHRDRMQAQFEHKQARDRERADFYERQPMKTVTVGMQSFQTPETQGLTGRQREKFLPQHSAVQRGGADTLDDIRGDSDFARFQDESEHRLAGLGFGPPTRKNSRDQQALNAFYGR